VLDREEELSAVASDEQEGVGPGEEVARAAEALPRVTHGAVLAGVVDDEHGDVVGALHLAEVAEERGDLPSVVLVDAVQSHERVEDEEPRCVLRHGVAETSLVMVAVETERGGEDEVHGQCGKVEAAMAADAFEARLDHGCGVLRHVEEDAPGVSDIEEAEARLAARDGERHLEREPGLATLRGAAEDADPCPGP
jgi:hypothetical protein